MSKRLGSLVSWSAVLSMALVACSNGNELATGPVDPQQEASFARGPAATTTLPLLPCPAGLPIVGAALVGPNGGTVRIGKHSLTIPKGALSRLVIITGIAPNDGVASLIFYPEGLRFAKPVKLKYDYKGCGKPAKKKRVVYVNDGLTRILEEQTSADNPTLSSVEGAIDHFSRYAIAW